MKLIVSVIALLAAAVLSVTADAQCTVRRAYTFPGTPAYVAPTYAAHQTYATNYATQVLAVPVIVPGYGVGFGGGNTGYLDGDAMQSLKAEVNALKQQNQLLMQFLQGGGKQSQLPQIPVPPSKNDLPQSKAPSGNHPGLAVVGNKCSSCHESKVATAKGGGIILLNGPNRSQISDATYKLLTKAMLKETMPPGGTKLTDEEATSVMELYLQ